MYRNRASGELPGDRGETIENVERPTAVSLGRLLDRHEAGHRRGPRLRAMPERDLPEDDQRTQAAFGVIVRRRHAGIVQKDQPAVRVAVDPLLQRGRLVVVQRAVLQSLQFRPQPSLFVGLLSRREAVTAAVKVAAPLDPLLDRLEEAIIRRIRRGEFLPVACRAGQVRQHFCLASPWAS